MSDISMVARHSGHSWFCALTCDDKQSKWNLWLHDNVKRGAPGTKPFKQIEQSSTVLFDDIDEKSESLPSYTTGAEKEKKSLVSKLTH